MLNLWTFDGAPRDEELVTVLHEDERVRIERIVSTGQCSPAGFWYDQQEDEFVALLAGRAVLRFADGTQTLAAGDTCLIPAGCRHRVEETSTDPACVWLCVFTKKEVGGWTAGR